MLHTTVCWMLAESPLDVESAVRRTIGANMQQQLLNIPGWRGFNNPWMAEDDQDVDFSYINLVDNPERYTGYKVLVFAQLCTCSTVLQLIDEPSANLLCLRQSLMFLAKTVTKLSDASPMQQAACE